MQHGTHPDKEALVRITGAETDNHTVPAEVLIRVLNGMRQTTFLLAAASLKHPIRQRFKPSEELRQRYELRCELPRPGSYALPILLEDDLHLLDKLHALMAAVSSGLKDAVMEVIPDSAYRNRALREFSNFLPKSGERWGVGFSVAQGSEIQVDTRSARVIEHWLTEEEPRDAIMTVTGELIGIDFDQNKVQIRYTPTGRLIECVYRPEIEDTIIESRRELIQVTGQFLLDEESNPVRLTDVTRIEAVDLSPMTFERLEYQDRALEFLEPLTLVPALDEESSQYYELRDETLDLFVYAPSREQLADELAEQLFMLWDEFAQAPPDHLTLAAQRVRLELLDRIREATHA